MATYGDDLLQRIYDARARAEAFFHSLKFNDGWRYTTQHDVETYPGAVLYGTWSSILGLHLLGYDFSPDEREWAMTKLLRHRREDGTFLGIGLDQDRHPKSLEYLILHCSNYAQGAAMALDPEYDYRSSYFDAFLDADFLARWLEGRSFQRPWEEGNNVVNVAGYLALCDDHDIPSANDRLRQMLTWHYNHQNPKTGGFDNFKYASEKTMTQAMAGAVHNYHIHLYLHEPFHHEALTAKWATHFLFQGMLTSCLSIDFTELGIRTLPYADEPQELAWSLFDHAEALLDAQRDDGGWFELDRAIPSGGNGFRDQEVASISYGTWFRLCSLGMIAIVLLGDHPDNWRFRKTLGMGYAPEYWPQLPETIKIEPTPNNIKLKYMRKALPNRAKKWAIRTAAKIIMR